MIYVPSLVARILNRLRLLSVLRVGYTLRILGQEFKIPVIENIEGYYYHLGFSEPFLLQVFRQLYSSSDFVFLDAGVNFGQTLLKVKAVKPDASYIGFEPSGLCSYYTAHLIKVNKIADARLIRCALSNSAGVLTLHAQSDGDTRATILDNAIAEEEDNFKEIVPAVTLDSLIPILTTSKKNIILKVDVEGAEWMVFQGGEKFIEDFRPLVVFENLPSLNNIEKQHEQQSISDYFIHKQYNIYLLDEIKNRLQTIESINNKTDYTKTNYLAIPAEKSNFLNGLHTGKA